jgi:serine/threonine-protein kinase
VAIPAPVDTLVEQPRELDVELAVVASELGAQPAAAGKAWHRSKWAAVGAAVVLAVLGTTMFWRVRPAETAHKAFHEPDPAAQDLYIRGRYLMDRQTEAALRESIDAFSQAVVRDAQFAPAYAGLADAYNILAQSGYIPPKEGMEQARRAAERALDIDPEIAEGHVSLAAIIEAYDWNWALAEHEYRRAIELNPGLPEAHLWYGMFLRDQGRLQEALPEMRRAAQLEPFSAFTAVNLAHAYMLAGNYGAAEEQAHHAASLAPGMVGAEVLLSSAYRAQSRTAEADAALARARQYAAGNPHAMSVLACAYTRHGQRDEGVRLFQQLELLAKQRYVSPFDLGSVSLVLGDDKRALDLLEEAYRQRSAGLIFLRDAKFANAHRSPGFDSLIEKMHFAS